LETVPSESGGGEREKWEIVSGERRVRNPRKDTPQGFHSCKSGGKQEKGQTSESQLRVRNEGLLDRSSDMEGNSTASTLMRRG